MGKRGGGGIMLSLFALTSCEDGIGSRMKGDFEKYRVKRKGCVYSLAKKEWMVHIYFLVPIQEYRAIRSSADSYTFPSFG